MKSYREQFDNLTRAYINGEVDPYQCKACFVGNMLDMQDKWAGHRAMGMDGTGYLVTADICYKLYVFQNAVTFVKNSGYTRQEIFDIEQNFLTVIKDNTVGDNGLMLNYECITTHPNYENALFLAFESTLELLKQIHISKGEVIDETPVFKKRLLSA